MSDESDVVYRVAWDNGHACGLLSTEYETEEAAKDAGADWYIEMMDATPGAADGDYEYEVITKERQLVPVPVGQALRGLAPIGVRWGGQLTARGPRPDKGCPRGEWAVVEAWGNGAWRDVVIKEGVLYYKVDPKKNQDPEKGGG